jgi:hypothetical protein
VHIRNTGKREKEREKQRQHLKQRWLKISPTLMSDTKQHIQNIREHQVE